jgi:mitochondrial fission protein ELM1
MVSEAMSSGKRVIAFELQKRTKGLTKHETALKDLERNGYLKISKPEDLFETLRKAWEDTAPVKGVDDRDRIFGAVRRLI